MPSIPALTGLLLLATSAAISEEADAPRWEPPLPTPPRQSEPWTPPASALPSFLNTAAADLFSQGLADPRGCEYRRIRVIVGSVWGGTGGQAATSGWVLPPSGPGAKPRFAIAWSGAIYPLVGLGEPADLDADVRSMGDRPGRGFDGLEGLNEWGEVAVATPTPIRLCLLLRLGRADLAEKLWKIGVGDQDGRPASGGISYLTLAQDLAWSHFNRAICAHMRGDDAVALADVRFLSAFERAVEARAAELGVPRPKRFDGGSSPYIDFLGQIPEFLADQERRAVERARPAKDEPVGESPEDRIAALIRDLDQVAERQWGQPGAVMLGNSPIVRGLIEQGDAAVDALIRDFRDDERLTRSVWFHRDFNRSRLIHRADQAAFAALTGILDTSDFGGDVRRGAAPTRRELADRIEDYWRKNRAFPLVERWYRKLADDEAGESGWLEAAGLIAQPGNVRVQTSGAFQTTTTSHLPPGARPRLRGEPLRDGREPSTSALMLRRAEAIVRGTGEGDRQLRAARGIVSSLAAWDAEAALPLMREVSKACRERFARLDDESDGEAAYLAVSIAEFTEARLRAGDAGASPEYADWIRTVAPKQVHHEALKILKPIADRPGDPALAEAAAHLFGDAQSPWLPLVGRGKGAPTVWVREMIDSSLLDVPAFRAAVLSGLDDRTPIGKTRVEGMSMYVEVENGPSTSTGMPSFDPEATAERPLRRCDYLAWLIASRKDAPSFNPCWEEVRRDAGVAAAADYLRRRAGG